MRWAGFLLMVWVWQVAAQQTSQLGRFSVDYSRGCAPLTVNVTEMDGFGAITRQYFYENSTDVTTSTTHIYTQPGTYQLVQLVGIDIPQKTDTLEIEVLPATEPEFTVDYCQSSRVEVTITDNQYDRYEVHFAGQPAEVALSGETLQNTFAPDDDLTIDVQGVLDDAADNCGITSVELERTFDNFPPITVDSVVVKRSCADVYNLQLFGDFDERLTYDVAQPGSTGTLYRGKIRSGQWLTNVPWEESAFTGTLEIAIWESCAQNRVNTATIHQDNIRIEEPLSIVYSTYTAEGKITLFFNDFTIGKYHIERRTNDSPFSERATTSGDFIDENIFATRSYSYRVAYLDTCGNTWGEKLTQPPFIKRVDRQDDLYELEITPPKTFPDEAHSMILTASGDSVTTVSAGNYVYEPRGRFGEIQEQRVEAHFQDHLLISNAVKVKFEINLHVPKAFTPNGDGLNDELEIFGLEGVEALFKVYNRWGQQVYVEASDSPSWNGQIDGSPAARGTYMYEISLTNIPDQIQRGTFVLLKK